MQKRINIQNKRARFEYEILDEYIAGIVLSGTEIKSIETARPPSQKAFVNSMKRESFLQ